MKSGGDGLGAEEPWPTLWMQPARPGHSTRFKKWERASGGHSALSESLLQMGSTQQKKGILRLSIRDANRDCGIQKNTTKKNSQKWCVCVEKHP